jgi:hypothetical protein
MKRGSHSPCCSTASFFFSHNPSNGDSVVSRATLQSTMLYFRYLGVAYMAFLSLASVMALTNAQDADPSPIRRRDTCSNNYRCPQYSYRKPGRDCYDSFDDCECVSKYHKEGKYCVKDNECNYSCPKYSYRKTGRDCYDNFDDCACVDNYHKEGNYCVRDKDKCNYRCPLYSRRKSGRDCYDDFNDCECDKGYKKYNNKCVKNY